MKPYVSTLYPTQLLMKQDIPLRPVSLQTTVMKITISEKPIPGYRYIFNVFFYQYLIFKRNN